MGVVQQFFQSGGVVGAFYRLYNDLTGGRAVEPDAVYRYAANTRMVAIVAAVVVGGALAGLVVEYWLRKLAEPPF
jgi:hypothetical protein